MEDEDVCDGIDLKWMHQSDSDDDDDWHNSAPVKYFTQEMSFRGRLRRILIRNTQARLGGRLFDFIVKFIMCVLYFIRVLLDDHTEYLCYGTGCGNHTEPYLYPQNEDDGMKFSSAEINWHVVLWVHRPMPLWCVQVILAFATFIKALLFIFVSKGNRFEQVLTSAFLLECICSLPIIATIFYPVLLKDLFVPTFLNCWLAKLALERLFNDLHLTKQRFQTISVTLSQQLLILNVTLCCLIFTTICGIQHIQRGSLDKHLTMFESFYFVIVTFSTVGYGDISPDIWLGQLFIVIMICVAFVFLPRQIEGIASTFVERQKAGGEYGKKQARRNRHVVVCSTKLTSEQTMDFLSEFYAHPKLEKTEQQLERKKITLEGFEIVDKDHHFLVFCGEFLEEQIIAKSSVVSERYGDEDLNIVLPLEEHIVLLLGSEELGSNMNIILRDPKWSNRVIYMRGSALKDLDLKRCRINDAEACFILTPGSCVNKEQADQHTILRSWAVKDFAPNCNQYIQLFRAENKMHVKFAEHVVCQDEFKYALLANNCCYPGLSTLVSLLVHTSTGHEGEMATETWQQVYGRHSGNEIYHIQLCKSKFFSSYVGKKFSEASAGAHERFGVTLMGIMETDTSQNNDIRLQLNPGPNYIMKELDFCFYMNITKEEYSTITDVKKMKRKTEREKNYEKLAQNLGKYLESHGCDEEEEDGEESVFNTLTSQGGSDMAKRMLSINSQSEQTDTTIELNTTEDHADGPDLTQSAKVLQMYDDMGQDEFVTGPPPIAMYLGTKKTICHLVRKRREKCCLKWGEDCLHCDYKNSTDPRWHNQLIILAGQQISRGIFNFIVPLRSQYISMKSLSPIILVLEEKPDKIFLETIAHFPMVYWMQGKITNVDDLLKAGINKACHLVVVNRESGAISEHAEEVLTDSETIVDVQTVSKLFPNTNIITELSQTQNMRFMQFQAHDQYTQNISRLEKKLKEEMHSSLTHIFRLPFAAGQVFSCSMLDSLLYQTFVKGYLIKFVRLLLGIDAEKNSGHLSSIKVKRSIIAKYRTYGDLYKGLCSVTGEIPIAIYRTERPKLANKEDQIDGTNNNVNIKKGKRSAETDNSKKVSLNIKQFYESTEHDGISDLIKHRMMSLDMDSEEYCGGDQKRKRPISYIMLNPSPKRKLKLGDLVYVIQPASMFAIPSRLTYQSKYARRRSWSAITERDATPPNPEDSSSRQRSHSMNLSHTSKRAKTVAGKTHVFTLEVPKDAHA